MEQGKSVNWRRGFPRQPREITKEWVQFLLQEEIPECPPLRSVRYEPIGTGQMGQNVRLFLEYAGTAHEAPSSLVLKFPSADPLSRATGMALRSYETEVRFYRTIARRIFLPAPRCYFARLEPRTGNFVIVLDDLGTAQPGDQLRPLTLKEVRAALSSLARIHGATWNHPKISQFFWLAKPSSERAQEVAEFFQAAVPEFLSRYRSQLDAEHIEVIEEFAPRFAEWMRLQRPPFALLHGDFRPDNLLFVPINRKRLRAFVVDWQTASFGPPASDVAYLLGGSLEPRDRRRWESRLLEYYRLRALHHQGRSRGNRPPPPFGMSSVRMQAEYRLFAFSGLVMAVAASILVQRTERGDQMFLTMLDRHVQQIIDVDAFALFSPKEQERLRALSPGDTTR